MIQEALDDGYNGAPINALTNRQWVTAFYENGVLHPTTALVLDEAQVVVLQILSVPAGVAL